VPAEAVEECFPPPARLQVPVVPPRTEVVAAEVVASAGRVATPRAKAAVAEVVFSARAVTRKAATAAVAVAAV
jgi:hypothetical protein